MYTRDLLRLASSSFIAYRMRSVLTGLGIAIGIAAVILLTSLGQGLHQFILHEFTQFGSNILAIQPGKTQTHGASVGMFGSVRPLTLADADALKRLPSVWYVNPSVQGNAELRFAGKTRRVTVYGSGPDLSRAFGFTVRAGQFLPQEDSEQARALVVIGDQVARELFAGVNPLGQYLRVGGQRFRVIGVMAPKGQMLGMELDDAVYLPAAQALALFNRNGLMEIQLSWKSHVSLERVLSEVKALLISRHGREDFTVVPQQQALATLDSVLSVITLAVAALGSISLLVGGVGILTIMIMAVSERTAEIGLLRALGARQQQILWLFLGEAVLLSVLGGIAGLLLGIGLAQLLHWLVPALPVVIPWFFVVLALLVSGVIGLLAGVLPAIRAARLDPVVALRSEA